MASRFFVLRILLLHLLIFPSASWANSEEGRRLTDLQSGEPIVCESIVSGRQNLISLLRVPYPTRIQELAFSPSPMGPTKYLRLETYVDGPFTTQVLDTYDYPVPEGLRSRTSHEDSGVGKRFLEEVLDFALGQYPRRGWPDWFIEKSRQSAPLFLDRSRIIAVRLTNKDGTPGRIVGTLRLIRSVYSVYLGGETPIRNLYRRIPEWRLSQIQHLLRGKWEIPPKDGRTYTAKVTAMTAAIGFKVSRVGVLGMDPLAMEKYFGEFMDRPFIVTVERFEGDSTFRLFGQGALEETGLFAIDPTMSPSHYPDITANLVRHMPRAEWDDNFYRFAHRYLAYSDRPILHARMGYHPPPNPERQRDGITWTIQQSSLGSILDFVRHLQEVRTTGGNYSYEEFLEKLQPLLNSGPAGIPTRTDLRLVKVSKLRDGNIEFELRGRVRSSEVGTLQVLPLELPHWPVQEDAATIWNKPYVTLNVPEIPNHEYIRISSKFTAPNSYFRLLSFDRSGRLLEETLPLTEDITF